MFSGDEAKTTGNTHSRPASCSLSWSWARAWAVRSERVGWRPPGVPSRSPSSASRHRAPLPGSWPCCRCSVASP